MMIKSKFPWGFGQRRTLRWFDLEAASIVIAKYERSVRVSTTRAASIFKAWISRIGAR
jgi:hypothetical protein